MVMPDYSAAGHMFFFHGDTKVASICRMYYVLSYFLRNIRLYFSIGRSMLSKVNIFIQGR